MSKEVITKDYFGDDINEGSVLLEVNPTFEGLKLKWKPFKKKWDNKKGYIWFARCQNGCESGLGDIGDKFVLERNVDKLSRKTFQLSDFSGTSYAMDSDQKIFNNLIQAIVYAQTVKMGCYA